VISCPHCGLEAQVIKAVDSGVCFRCPKHGTCGLRFDSMTRREAEGLGELERYSKHPGPYHLGSDRG